MPSVILAAVAVIGYLAAATALYAFGLGVVMTLPWWVALAAPAAVYAVLTLPGRSRVPWTRRAAVFVALCAVHATLAAATGAAFMLIKPAASLDALSHAALSFLPVPLLQVIGAPLVLLPFRALLRPRPRRGPARPGPFVNDAPRPAQRPVRRIDPSVRPVASLVVGPPRLLPAVARAPAPVATGPASTAREMGVPVNTDRRPVPGISASPFATPPRNMAVTPALVEKASVAERVASPPGGAPPVVVKEPVASSEPVVGTTDTAPVASVGSQVATEPAEDKPAAGMPGAPVATEPPDAVISIPFHRIADQLPAEAFSLPIGRLADNLPEPGRLRISQRLVIAQLGEGLVRIGWEDIAAQFPRHALTMGDGEVAARIAGGRIVLPLDEVVRRLPPQVFSLAMPAPELLGIESFPLPFQPPAATLATDVEVPEPTDAAANVPPVPVLPEAAVPEAEPLPIEASDAPSPAAEVTVADTATGDASEMDTPTPHTVREESADETVAAEMVRPAEGPPAEALLVEIPAVEAPALPAPVLPLALAEPRAELHEEEEPSDQVETPAPSETQMPASALAADQTAEEPEAPVAAGEDGSEDVTWGDGAAAAPAADWELEAPASKESVPVVAQAESRRLTAALAPVGGLAVDVARADGVTLFTFIAPALPAEAVTASARRCLPLLARGRAPWPVEQLTVRREGGAIVLTPLDDTTVMVASLRRGGSLALLEIRCRQAAAGRAAGSSSAGVCEPEPDEAARLIPVAGGPAAELLAGSLGVLGPLSPTVLREEGAALELCLLLPPGEDAQAIGRFAHTAVRALAGDADDDGLGRLDSVEFRLGERRLLLRPTDTPGRWTALGMAGDGSHRRGWAHVRMARLLVA